MTFNGVGPSLVKKIVGLIIVCSIVVALALALFANPSEAPTRQPSGPLDFTVSGTSDCLRFLNSSVPTIYVPFTVAANENWELNITCNKMPGGVNGYTDVYIYEGYWDSGTNHTCVSSDLYQIIGSIQSVDQQIRLDQPFTAKYGGKTQQSYTAFFVVPPGGQQATFHITLKPV